MSIVAHPIELFSTTSRALLYSVAIATNRYPNSFVGNCPLNSATCVFVAMSNTWNVELSAQSPLATSANTIYSLL